MLEFTKYDPETPEEGRKGAPLCVVAYPNPCGHPAVGEVWGLSFCEAHGNEAHIAARLEAYEDAEKVLDRLTSSVEGEHAVRNPLVYGALKGIVSPPNGFDLNHDEAIRAAYVLRESDTDPDTLAYDYDVDPGGGPYDWWNEACEMVVGFMREAYEAGQPHLLASLEPIREHATVQQVLAYEDMNRRWVAPRRAAREGAAGLRPVE